MRFARVLRVLPLVITTLVGNSLHASDRVTTPQSQLPTLVEPVHTAAPQGNAGVFVGVNEFTSDKGLSALRYAVNDAVELAHLFVVELELIPPQNCFLLLSGKSRSEIVKRHLKDLELRGAKIRSAGANDLLTAFNESAGIAKQSTSMLIGFLGTHGFDVKRRAHVMPQDGTRVLLERTSIQLTDLETQMETSKAGHRLLLIDACQERIAARATAGQGAAMTDAFMQQLQSPSGQARLASCSPKELSREFDDLGGVGHGVFTYAFLEACRGTAQPDDDGLIRLGNVADTVSRRVNELCKRFSVPLQSPSLHGPVTVRSLPLASRADSVTELISRLKLRETTKLFTEDLKSAVIQRLEQIESDASKDGDQAIIGGVKDLLSNRSREEIVVTFFKTKQTDWQDPDQSRLEKQQLMALSIGQYEQSQFDLPGTEDDSNALRQVMEQRCGFQVSPEDSLSRASAEKLEIALNRWGNQNHPSAERAVFYYRGHLALKDGAPFLAGSDFTTSGTRSRGALSLKSVIGELRRMTHVEHAVVLLDVENDDSPDDVVRSLQSLLSQPAEDGPVVSVLAGCLPRQHRPSDTSPVTRAIVQNLRGPVWNNSSKPNSGDGTGHVDLSSMADDLRRKLKGVGHVALVRSTDKPSKPPVEPRPKWMTDLTQDFADALADQLIENGIELAVIAKFEVETSNQTDELPGEKCGPLTVACRTRFRRDLAVATEGRVAIASDSWAAPVLGVQNVNSRTMCSPEAMQKCIEACRTIIRKDRIAIVFGKVTFRGGPSMQLQCVAETHPQGRFSKLSGQCVLTEDEWGMSGRSGVNPTVLTRTLNGVEGSRSARSATPNLFHAPDLDANWDSILTLETSEHPLADSSFPYRLSLLLEGETKPIEPSISDNRREAFINLQPKDQYTIVIDNNSGRPVFMRLLVDGLNTLPDHPLIRRSSADQPFVEGVRYLGGDSLLAGQPVNLREARSWYCEAGERGGPRQFGIRGFFSKIDGAESGFDPAAEFSRFVVTDAEAALASQLGRPEQVGFITAAFYEPVHKSKINMSPVSRYGTKMGDKRSERVDVYAGHDVPGSLIAIVNLRYGGVVDDEDDDDLPEIAACRNSLE